VVHVEDHVHVVVSVEAGERERKDPRRAVVPPRGAHEAAVPLVVGIVVAALRAARPVPGQDHRHALGEEEDDGEVPDLPLAQRLDGRVGRLPSKPQFQLRLSLVPSRLPSPFASLCLAS
jgi:hypothetical protein